MEIDYGIIGERIKRERLKKKLTQVELSEMIDVSVVYLSRVERGSTHINLKRLIEICNVLEITPGEILQGTSPDESNYLSRDFSQILKNCGGEKQKLIYEIAKLVEQVNI